MIQNELLPCPFCHGTRGRPMLEELNEEHNGYFRVICYGCCVMTSEFPNKADAVTTWNTRIESAQAVAPGGVPALVGVLKQSQQQCDEDGTMIAVSRQALDELIALVESRNGPEGEDGPWASGWNERAGIAPGGGDIEANRQAELDNDELRAKLALAELALHKIAARRITSTGTPSIGVPDLTAQAANNIAYEAIAAIAAGEGKDD